MTNINKRIPLDVTEVLSAFADRIVVARKARMLRQNDVAAMAGVSRSTLVEIEKGSPYVSIGNYLQVLWAMNLHEQVNQVAKSDDDAEAVAIMASNLPQRVRV